MRRSTAWAILRQLKEPNHVPVATHTGPFDTAGLELRQVSGLTAGAALSFVDGEMKLSTDATSVGFRLDVDGDGEVVITAVGTPVRLDERLINQPPRSVTR